MSTETDNVSEDTPLLGSVNESIENDGGSSNACISFVCDPKRPYHKYFVLCIMVFLSFGSYFCYDNPAALQDEIKQDMGVNTAQFMSLYEFYSWPNVVLCLFGGFLIDKVFGIRWGAIIFSIFVTVGQAIFAVGALTNQFWLMQAGRFVFGIGGESLCVAQNTYAVSWFKDRELNMVFGLQLSFSRVGSTVNMVTMKHIYDRFHSKMGYQVLGTSLLIAGGFCIFSLVCALLMSYFDKRANRILQKEDISTNEKVKLSDVRHFPLPLWLLAIICVAFYVSIFPFIGLGLVFFEMKYQLSPAKASAVNSIVYILSAFASPVFGFLIDKSGHNIFWVIAGVSVTLGCHAMMAFTFITPYLPMIVMGMSYSILASALWPMVAMVIPEHQLGTAYGVMQSVQNLGLAVVSYGAGLLVDGYGYLILEMFFMGWLCVALVAAIVLYLYDQSQSGNLNLSSKQRLAIRN